VSGRPAVAPQGRRTRRAIRSSRRAISPLLTGVVIVSIAAVLALVFLPLPWIGLDYYNVKVDTTLGETCFIACSYSVQSVNPSVTGPSTVIDICALLGSSCPGASVAPPCINCQYKVVAELSNGQSTSASESKFVSNLINIDYQDSLSMAIAYVPAGSYGVTVTIYLNGANVASGTGNLNVGS
jgi:hypothetical protein